MRLPALLLAALLLLGLPAAGQEPPLVPLRVGTHPDFGRLVFDWPSRVGYGVEEAAGGLVIRFQAPGRIDLAAARRPPRNVLSVEQQGETIGVRIVPGARPRHFRLGNRIVIDLRDPAAEPAAASLPPRPLPSPPPPLPPAPAAAEPVPARPAAMTATSPPAPPPGAVAPPPPLPARPVAIAATPRPATPPAAVAPPPVPAEGRQAPAPPVPGGMPVRLLPAGPGIAFDAGADAGLAVFRRGDWLHLILDRAVTPDLSALRGHGVFGALEADAAGEGTAFRLPLPAPARLAIRRDGAAWVLDATRQPAPADAAVLRAVADPGPPDRLLLEGGQPGGVVAIADPATGETLLVGTLRQPGPAVPLARRLPSFDLLPTMLGAAVVARSDRLRLRATTGDRLALEAATGEPLGLGVLPGREPPPAAIAMTRLLDLPSGAVPELLERLRTVLSSVNATAPLARGPGRRDAAETLLALGMPQEAQAMATLAFQEDPQAREDARLLLAYGAAALLAGRPGDARAIDDARLPPRDEVALWRGLLALSRGEPAAAALRATAPVVLAYPEGLRGRALPMVAEGLAEGGETTAAAALLHAAGEMPGLDLARAMVAEAQGRRDAAAVLYDRLATGRDRRQRAMAMRRLADMQLAAGSIDGAAAADTLEQSLYAWRGGVEEVALRRRIAAMRIAAGQGQQAFALLDETGRLFPDQSAALRPAVQDAFAAALETAPPIAAATLFDAHPDMLPAGARGQAAVLVLADRLAGLDLTDRAAALLRRSMAAAEDRPARAAIGARLAALRAVEGDAAGVIEALDASESDGLDASLAARRTTLRARALARRGARMEAEALLAGLGAHGAAIRAELRAEVQDWPGAAAAMAEHLAAGLPPPSQALAPEHRAALARQAAYLALAGDEAGLAVLRAAQGSRMEGGALAEAFGVLTADPLRGIADLPRLQRDLGMARILPTRLDGLRAETQVAR
jgi:predicted negative regulator of RcsB-dependent stress response